MKPTMNFDKGESTKQHVERKVTKYLDENERAVSIKEVYEYLSQRDATVSRMTEQGFKNMVGKQILHHTMDYM